MSVCYSVYDKLVNKKTGDYQVYVIRERQLKRQFHWVYTHVVFDGKRNRVRCKPISQV